MASRRRKRRSPRLQPESLQGVATGVNPLYHPDDWLFRDFRRQIETEQGTKAAKKRRRRQRELPFKRDADTQANPFGIVPLRSNALAVRFAEVAPGPDFVAAPRAEQRDPAVVAAAPVGARTPARRGRAATAILGHWQRFWISLAARSCGGTRSRYPPRLSPLTIQVDAARAGIGRDEFLEAMTAARIGVGVH